MNILELKIGETKICAAPSWLDAVKEDARKAGYEIKEDGTATKIFVPDSRKKNKALRGIYIYPDGTGFDITVRLDVAKALRGEKQIRSFLKI